MGRVRGEGVLDGKAAGAQAARGDIPSGLHWLGWGLGAGRKSVWSHLEKASSVMFEGSDLILKVAGSHGRFQAGEGMAKGIGAGEHRRGSLLLLCLKRRPKEHPRESQREEESRPALLRPARTCESPGAPVKMEILRQKD